MSADLGVKVRKSILALQGRQAMIFALNLGVGVILARKLGPEIFGIYGIATFCLSLVTMATDFGIAGSLVQRKEAFGEHEISVAFTLQAIISLGAATLVWLLAPLSLLVYRHAPPELVWIVRALTVPMLLSPISTTAKLQLERDIQFQKIATIDIVATVVGSVVVLASVFAGFGVWSFVFATFSGGLTTAVVAWSMIKFHPKFTIDRKLTKELFSFGMFFQFGNITNEAAGWIIPLISGSWLGPAAVGLLTWASSNGRRPLMVVENVMRVAFPHFSRLQEHPIELGKQVDLYFRRLLVICYAWAFLGFLLAPPLTHIVYTDKWMPGVVALQLFALGLSMDVANWVGGMTLTAVGGVKETAKWTLVKSVLAIGGAFAGVRMYGMEAIPVASIFASLVSGFGIIVQLRRRVPFHLSVLWAPAIPYLIGLVVYLPFLFAPDLIRSIAAWAIGGAAIAFTAKTAIREFSSNKPIGEISTGI